MDTAPTPPALSEKATRRNIAYSAVNQFFVEASMTMSEATTVLPLFVKALGGSNFLAGLLPSLRWFGWLAPQFFAAGRMQRLSRFLPTVQWLEVIRSTFYLAIAALAFFLGPTRPGLVLAAFFVLFMVTRFAAGSSAVARTEIVARIVPPEDRATVLSVRRVGGGIAGFLAGFVVSTVLDERVAQFPANYAILIGLSGIGFALAIVSLMRVVEAPAPVRPREISASQQIRRAPGLIRNDRRYAMYVGVRAAASGINVAAPFYILYATEVLGAPAAVAGVFISLRTAMVVLSNVFWGNLCRRKGSLWVLRTAYVLGTLAPAAVVAMALAAPLAWPGQPPAALIWAMGLVFVAQGLASSAQDLGEMAYLFDMAPEQERPTYYGLINTLLGPLYFLPALAGALLDTVGYGAIFGAAALMMLAANLLATRLSRYEKANGYEPAAAMKSGG